jgi:hypothetical protein
VGACDGVLVAAGCGGLGGAGGGDLELEEEDGRLEWGGGGGWGRDYEDDELKIGYGAIELEKRERYWQSGWSWRTLLQYRVMLQRNHTSALVLTTKSSSVMMVCEA